MVDEIRYIVSGYKVGKVRIVSREKSVLHVQFVNSGSLTIVYKDHAFKTFNECKEFIFNMLLDRIEDAQEHIRELMRQKEEEVTHEDS